MEGKQKGFFGQDRNRKESVEIHSSYLSPQHLEASICAAYCTCMILE
jgi:hypothetical protein